MHPSVTAALSRVHFTPAAGRLYSPSLADAESAAATAESLIIAAVHAPEGVARNAVLRSAADFARLADAIARPLASKPENRHGRRASAASVVARAAAVTAQTERLWDRRASVLHSYECGPAVAAA